MVQRFHDAAAGKKLVDRITAGPEVIDALAAVRRDQTLWNELLGPGRYGR